MEKSFSQVGRQQRRPRGQGVVEDGGRQHRGVEQGRKVVVEVKDPEG